MLPLLNYILLILPKSRFSPHFSQPLHTDNILDYAKKIEKGLMIS